MNAAAIIRAATLMAQRRMNQLDARALADLTASYREALDDICRRLGRLPADEVVSHGALANLTTDITKRIRQLSAAQSRMLDEHLSLAAALGASPFEFEGAASKGQNRVAIDAVAFVRAFRAADGLRLSDRLWRLENAATQRVQNVIDMAVIQGWDAEAAAQRLLEQQKPVPEALQASIEQAKPPRLGESIADELMRAPGCALFNARRVMRTELNRAHGEAYIASAFRHPDTAGIRFELSPRHPKRDVCDVHAIANLYGLGPGVYPSREACPWPAHPNTLSYVTVVFRDEVSEADKNGRETFDQAAARLPPVAPRPRPQRERVTHRRPQNTRVGVAVRPPHKREKPVLPAGPIPDIHAVRFSGNCAVHGDINIRINGVELTPNDLAGLCGAMDGADIAVNHESPGNVELSVAHPFLAGQMERVICIQKKRVILLNELFKLKPEYQAASIGVRAFAWEVHNATRLGFAQIQTIAAGHHGSKVFNGYYTWPRLGYDAPLMPDERAELPDHLSNAKTVLDLMETESGRDWWKKFGTGREMVFDLTPGSRSQHALSSYLNGKGIAMKTDEHGQLSLSAMPVDGYDLAMEEETPVAVIRERLAARRGDALEELSYLAAGCPEEDPANE